MTFYHDDTLLPSFKDTLTCFADETPRDSASSLQPRHYHRLACDSGVDFLKSFVDTAAGIPVTDLVVTPNDALLLRDSGDELAL